MILKRTGTNKSVPSEDLPDLPCFIVKKLKKQIESIAKDTYKSKKMDLNDINKVRIAFYEFFMEPLKYFNVCRKKIDTVHTDFDQLFDQKAFLKCFQSCSVQEIRFLDLFT